MFQMKRMQGILMVFATVLGLLAQVQEARAAGGDVSGGGDLRAIQFRRIGEILADVIENGQDLPEELKKINGAKLRKAVKKTVVESTTDPITLDSRQTVPAKIIVTKDGFFNRREKMILFHREAWDLIPEGSRRATLVLHEYLGIMGGVDDSNYDFSKVLYENPGMKLIFNSIPETQLITDGLDFDFLIRCDGTYKGRSLDRTNGVDPIIIGSQRGQGWANSTSLLGRDIDHNAEGETLSFWIYDESNPDNVAIGIIPRKSTKSLMFLLGWGVKGFLTMPTRNIFSMSVKLAPNFEAHIDLPEVGFKLDCHRLTMEELRKAPRYIPVGQ